MLPDGAGVALDLARVPVLPVFKWLAATGGIAEPEMLRTFNCGIGMIAIVDAGGADAITAVLTRAGETVVRLGTVTTAAAGAPRVAYSGQLDLAVIAMAKKRVAILISGRGSNMASLIAAAKDDSYPAEIALVVSNRPDAAGLDARQAPGHRHRGRRPHAATARTAPPSSAPCRTCSTRIASSSCAWRASCAC